MPFRSQAQARFLFSQKPKIAKEFASKTKSIKALPNKVKSPKAPKYQGRGTPARLNTAASKMFFTGNSTRSMK